MAYLIYLFPVWGELNAFFIQVSRLQLRNCTKSTMGYPILKSFL